ELLKMQNGEAVTSANWEARREELLSVLDREIYGTAPAAPVSVRVTAVPNKKKYGDCAGKAVISDLTLSFDTDRGEFTFPAVEVLPKGEGKVPVFVFLNFSSDVPHKYFPVEEIVDSGCAVVRIYYNDITKDEDDGFSSGLAAMYDRERDTWGKIRMWAFAASRVMDYLETTDYADLQRVAVVGHSRLGKTALVAGAYDPRFALACSNDSGCSGAAITRGKKGERVKQITSRFPHWFCEKYRDYTEKEDEMPFEQHFLVGAIAPRRVAIGSAIEDEWACPVSEYLCAVAASPAWELFGKRGCVHPDRLPEVGDCFAEGNVSYHLRAGTHYLSRADWAVYWDLIKK
ncbi:MAG: acetylxylan esterase, partial [Clostridia bacterium]|nr:acetylxylan esterase [Clostridia bacterium]